MDSLIVTCNSLDSVVEYKSEHGILSTLTWIEHADGSTGFSVKNADILIDAYRDSFYVLEPAAAVQFIMVIASRIMTDQGLEDTIFLNMEGDKKSLPFFLPNTVKNDEDVLMLPHLQLIIVQLWGEYIFNFGGYLTVDLIDAAHDRGVLEAFLDLVNVQLSLLDKGDDEDE